MPYTIMPFGTFFRTGDLNFHVTGMHRHIRFSLHSAELHFARTVFRHIVCSPMCIVLSIFRVGINHLQREKNPGADLMQEVRLCPSTNAVFPISAYLPVGGIR